MNRGQRIRQNIALLCLGIIAGAALVMVVQGNVLDGLYLKQAQLKMDNDELSQELNHVEQELFLLTAQRSLSNPTLRSIKITVENGDSMTQLEASKAVKQSLNFLIGTQVRLFADAPSVISQVVDRKTLTVNGQPYALSLRTAVLLNDTLYVTVRTAPAKP